jgi:beta-galactosidase
MVLPFTANALAARGPMLGRRQIGMAILEGKLGKGHILCSQLDAVGQWGVDPSASTYLRNLLQYIIVDKEISKFAQPWEMPKVAAYEINPARAVMLNLKSKANRSFTDDVENDGKGGWTDQGGNDFRMMPLGKQTLAGVPFDIIDPAKNDGKSCLVLHGADRVGLPATISDIPVHAALKRLYFLHTCAWGKAVPLGEYRMHYADGSVERYVIQGGRNIDDWWNCSNLPNALVGLTRVNQQEHSVGWFVTPWVNPKPAVLIESIEVVSNGIAVPVVAAITGEK